VSPIVNNFKDDLSKYALLLRNANPDAWEAFLKTFACYAQEVLENTSMAPADQVLRMQGRAQQCRALLQIFRDCASPSRKPAPQ
jgi:hypothetical protein